MVNKKCSSCGGNLVFSPSTCSLICEKCKAITAIIKDKNFKKNDYDGYLKGEIITKSQSNKKSITNCPTCGASVNLKTGEFAVTCPYCNTSIVIDNAKNSLSVDAVIPFTIDKKQVYENYKKSIGKKFFLPNAFKKQPPMDKVTGFYIPSFGFDANTENDYYAVLETSHTDKDGHNHISTKTVRGHKNIQFENVLIESSSKINQLDLDAILPYNVSSALSYNDDFIRGYSVEKFSDTLQNCFILAKQEMNNMIRNEVLSKYTYDRVITYNCNTIMTNKKFCYYMLPVYSIEFDYKQKKYHTLMNGQTGKVGTGLPKSKIKIAFTALTVILIFLLFIILGAFLSVK